MMTSSANGSDAGASNPAIESRHFGIMPDGRGASLYVLRNAKGFEAAITNYGGTVVSLRVPDRGGQFADIVLGFDGLEDYRTKSPYFGCLVGRVGNRIAHGRFELDGVNYTLAQNNHPGGIPCSLHGGIIGFDKVLWDAEAVSRNGVNALRLSYLSRDGEEGFPGNLKVTVHYWLDAEGTLGIEYEAYTDKATPVSLTNHAYFNLAGEGSPTINDHILTIHAKHFTPVNQGQIPTGEIAPVLGTPFDFTSPRAIGSMIDAEDPQIATGPGYDHNWVLDSGGGGLAHAATVCHEGSGRVMEVWTREPGVQFYAGNSLDGSLVGKSGRPYARRSGFCLETQRFPDAPNQPGFPSIILRPGERYHSVTEHRFAVF